LIATPVAGGWKAQLRFAGRTDAHTCAFSLPKTGQLVQRGESGQKAADGTLRP